MSFECDFIELGSICEIKSGKRLPKGHTLTSNPTPNPYIRLVDIDAGRISRGNIQFIDESTKAKIKKYIIEEDDVCLAIVGHTIGMVFFVEKEWDGCNLTENAARITKLDGRFNPKFIYYYLNSVAGQHEIVSRKVGSAQGKLPLYNINRIPIPNIKLLEQNFIVTILDNLDKKIRLNEIANQTLEQMAQSLFKSWFVDFEPVKAKIAVLEAGGSPEDATLAAMTAISGKDTEALTVFEREHPEQYAELKATAELFPFAMQDSEMGEIPVGWESSPLSEKIKLTGGGTPKRSEPAYWDGDICWYSVKDAPAESDIFVIDTTEKITKNGLNKSSAKLLPIGTTIISARGTVGKLALTATEMAMNQSCYGITGGEYSGPLLTYLKVKQCVDVLKRNTHGAVFDTITTSTFDTVVTLTASKNINHQFEKTVTPLFRAIEKNLRANACLTQLRDTLLPKLLSGEINLPEAEQAVSEVENV